MPSYTFINENDGQEETHFMTVKEREEFLEENPNYRQKLSAPKLVDPVSVGVTKPDTGFTDILKNIKKNNLHTTIDV